MSTFNEGLGLPLSQADIIRLGLLGQMPRMPDRIKAALPLICERAVAEGFVYGRTRQLARLACGVMWRESEGGLALDESGMGDNGNAAGRMQVDRHAWPDRYSMAIWPPGDVLHGVRILASCLVVWDWQDLEAACSYNAGPQAVSSAVAKGHDPDGVTADHNYGHWVLDRLAEWEKSL